MSLYQKLCSLAADMGEYYGLVPGETERQGSKSFWEQIEKNSNETERKEAMKILLHTLNQR